MKFTVLIQFALNSKRQKVASAGLKTQPESKNEL